MMPVELGRELAAIATGASHAQPPQIPSAQETAESLITTRFEITVGNRWDYIWNSPSHIAVARICLIGATQTANVGARRGSNDEINEFRLEDEGDCGVVSGQSIAVGNRGSDERQRLEISLYVIR